MAIRPARFGLSMQATLYGACVVPLCAEMECRDLYLYASEHWTSIRSVLYLIHYCLPSELCAIKPSATKTENDASTTIACLRKRDARFTARAIATEVPLPRSRNYASATGIPFMSDSDIVTGSACRNGCQIIAHVTMRRSETVSRTTFNTAATTQV